MDLAGGNVGNDRVAWRFSQTGSPFRGTRSDVQAGEVCGGDDIAVGMAPRLDMDASDGRCVGYLGCADRGGRAHSFLAGAGAGGGGERSTSWDLGIGAE